MALLDFSRFGVTAKDVKNGVYSYIIGFDLGDGEISAAYWDLADPGYAKPADLDMSQDEDSKLVSGFFEDESGNIIMGNAMKLANMMEVKGNLFVNFKIPPERLAAGEKFENTDRTCLQLMQTLLKSALEEISKHARQNMFFSNGVKRKGILAVGCPSSPEWSDNGYDVMYAEMLAEAIKDCPLDLKVVIMPESRASLVKAYKESSFTDKIKGGVIVIDHGSSTLDITVIDFASNTHFDYSIPLGAKKIERRMIENLVREDGRTLADVKQARFQTLAMRGTKEAYFSTPLGSPKVFIEYNDDDFSKIKIKPEFMEKVTHEDLVSYCTALNGTTKGTWAELHRQFVDDSIKSSGSDFVGNRFAGVIILTGGASKMDFIETTLRKLYPHALDGKDPSAIRDRFKPVIYKDPEPSYCVSRGLAWAAYTDLKALELIEKVKQQMNDAIRADYSSLMSIIAHKVAPVVYDYAVSQLEDWVENGDDVTSKQLVEKIQKSFLNPSAPGGSYRLLKIQSLIKESVIEYLNNNSSTGIRAKIVETVNTTFASTFPGKIKAGDIPPFAIDNSEWRKVIEDVSSDSFAFGSSILNALDLENLLVSLFKVVIALAVLFVAFALDILTLGAFDFTEKCDKLFTDNGDKKMSRNKRIKAYNKIKEEKTQTINRIETEINNSSDSNKASDALSSQIVKTLSPSIDKAVNVVSIYF